MAQSNIGFPEGINTAWPKVQANFDELYARSVNVVELGADNTGVTDSSSVFDTALATGSPVYVPSGTYKASFDMPNESTIFGDGPKNKTIIKPPTGATYTIRIDATTSARQWITVNNISLSNIDAISNCVGLLFNADDVNDINDQHSVSGLYINGFDRSIEILGRTIWSHFSNIETLNSRIGLNVNTDPTSSAFNSNAFVNCKFSNNSEEGIRILGRSLANKFLNVNIEVSNTDDAAGKAAVYIEDSIGMVFDNCYLESNGDGVAVDTVTKTNNSYGFHFAGSYNYNISIVDSYLQGSGIMFYFPNGTTFRGSKIDNNRIISLSGGYAIHAANDVPDRSTPKIAFTQSNYTDDLIDLVSDVNGQFPVNVEQSESQMWLPFDDAISLRNTSNIVVNPNGTTFTGITTINNRIPGMRFTIHNYSESNTFTIPSSIMSDGVDNVIPPKSARFFVVGGFAQVGKLIEIG